MKIEHTYVECHGCKWQIEQNIVPDRNWKKTPCPKCNNTRLVVDPRELLCNLCGGCVCPLGMPNEQYPHGLYQASVTGGYDSYHLLDLNKYTFSFCEECLRKLFMVCKIPPEVEDAIHGQNKDYSFEDDQKYYEYREWKSMGGFHEAYLNKMCNSITACQNPALYTVLFSDEFSEYSCCEEHKSEHKNTVNATFVKFISNVFKPFL